MQIGAVFGLSNQFIVNANGLATLLMSSLFFKLSQNMTIVKVKRDGI